MYLFLSMDKQQKIMELQSKISVLETQIKSLQEELKRDKTELDNLTTRFKPNASIYEVNVKGINYLKASFQYRNLDGSLYRSTIHIGRTDKYEMGKDDPKIRFELDEKMKKIAQKEERVNF